MTSFKGETPLVKLYVEAEKFSIRADLTNKSASIRPFSVFSLRRAKKPTNIKMQIVVAELRAVNSPCCGQTLRYTSGKGLSQTEKPGNNEAGREEERGFGLTPKPPET